MDASKRQPKNLLRNVSRLLMGLLIMLATAGTGRSSSIVGSIFLTGHDPDFHAAIGGNAIGAQHITQDALQFITDPAFNTFAAGGITKFLYVESSISPPGGHIDGDAGLVASGFVDGVNFDEVDASTLNAALNNLGTSYDAIVVASDFGALLTQQELDILNARSGDIINFLNSGGGIFAMAESGSAQCCGLTTSGQFGFLPFVVSSAQLNQSEVGNTVTAFGAGLGLTNSDVNGNASHNIFTSTGGLNIVDFDSAGHILTLAGRGQVSVGGIVPEPGTMVLLGSGLVVMFIRSRRRSKSA